MSEQNDAGAETFAFRTTSNPPKTARKASYELQRRSLWRRKFRHCHYCDVRLTLMPGRPHSMTLDHKIPLARGGGNKPVNYAACCGPCNNAKGAMTEAEFRQKRARSRPHTPSDGSQVEPSTAGYVPPPNPSGAQ